jgi:hypothetical protein
MSAVDIEVDTNRRLVIVTPAQSITVEQACDTLRAMVLLPDFRISMPSIWDLRHTELMHINGQDIGTLSKVAHELKEQRGAAKTAIVVGSDLSYGLGRMFELLNGTSHLEARVFRDMASAEFWVQNHQARPTPE